MKLQTLWILFLLPVGSAFQAGPLIARPQYETEDVRYSSGENKLAALLMVPKSDRPVPAIVIIQAIRSE